MQGSQKARMQNVLFLNYSPDGFLMGVLIGTGSPKFGVPSAFQVNF
jgi:hypothetical protein